MSVILVVKSSSLLIPLVVLIDGLICGGEIGKLVKIRFSGLQYLGSIPSLRNVSSLIFLNKI
jgi:hypothetical protein